MRAGRLTLQQAQCWQPAVEPWLYPVEPVDVADAELERLAAELVEAATC